MVGRRILISNRLWHIAVIYTLLLSFLQVGSMSSYLLAPPFQTCLPRYSGLNGQAVHRMVLYQQQRVSRYPARGTFLMSCADAKTIEMYPDLTPFGD